MIERRVKSGELLAMPSSRLLQDRKGFLWMMGSAPLPNERKGGTIIVSVRGELEHHKEEYSPAESYEGILEKFRAAYAGESIDEDGESVCEPPKRIVLCLDSPGGVVSGLNECVAELQRMRKAHPEIPVTCYVNEMATSAAYALACSCDEIVCPPSAILGSIGVISTMISAAGADKKAGYDVRLLTSGARKADGHLHAPISDDAIAVETQRVEKLALAFFRLAGKARGMSVKKIQSFQAGIFLGKDAIREGLADRLMAYSDLLAGKQDDASGQAAAGGNQTDRRLKGQRMNLSSLIKKTKAALAKEDDPKKIQALSGALASYAASLEAYKKTEKHIEHVKTEEGDEDDDEEEEAEEKGAEDEEEEAEEKGAEDEKAKAAAAKKADEEASAAAAKSEDDDSDDDDDDSDDEDEKKSAKKALALVQRLTGMTGKKALGAMQAIAMTAANTAQDVAALKRASLGRDKASLIASAKGKYLTAKEASWLGGQKMSVVQGFVEMRRKAGVIVNTDDSTLLKPKDAKPGTEASLPEFVRNMIDDAVATMPAAKREQGRKELVEAHLKSHNEQLSHALNGAADGRY